MPRHLYPNALRPDELITSISFLAATGGNDGAWVKFPNAVLVSPHYENCYIAAPIAESQGHAILPLAEENVRSDGSPAGVIRSTRYILLIMILGRLPPPASNPGPWFLKTYVVDDDRFAKLGVNIILGRSFINAIYGPSGWPLQHPEHQQYVFSTVSAQGPYDGGWAGPVADGHDGMGMDQNGSMADGAVVGAQYYHPPPGVYAQPGMEGNGPGGTLQGYYPPAFAQPGMDGNGPGVAHQGYYLAPAALDGNGDMAMDMGQAMGGFGPQDYYPPAAFAQPGMDGNGPGVADQGYYLDQAALDDNGDMAMDMGPAMGGFGYQQ